MTRSLWRTAALAAAVLWPLAGCADDPAAPPTTPTDAAADTSGVTVRGVFVETLYDGAAMRVDHEAMPTLGMPAMQMALPLDRPALADGLAPGDKVELRIEAAPRLRVTAVTPLPDDTPLTLASDAAPSDSTAPADSTAP